MEMHGEIPAQRTGGPLLPGSVDAAVDWAWPEQGPGCILDFA